MNADQKYGFDVWGFVHLPQTLSGDELAACTQVLGDAGSTASCRALSEHSVLADCLQTILGDGHSLDQALVRMDPGADASTGVRLEVGTPERNRRLRYIRIPGAPVCHGLRVIWALEKTAPGQGLVLVPASHKRTFDPPAELINGTDDLGTTVELSLQAGDLVILATTTLFGIRGRECRLVKSEYASQRMMPSDGFAEQPAPDWLAELTPEQQAMVGPRITGIPGLLVSDGTSVRLVDEAEQTPTADLQFAGAAALDPKELFFWDVNGYLPVRDIIDQDWLAAAHRAIDTTVEGQPTLPDGDLAKFEEVEEAVLRDNGGQWPAEVSNRLLGEIHRPRIGGLYELPKPNCDPFRRMIGHPPIVQRLTWMLGSGFKEFFEPMCCVYPTGTTGGSIHGQTVADFTTGARFPLGDNLNLLWSLNDEAAGFGDDSGGFVCIPGSHKACFPIPRPEATSIDLPQVHKPPLKAGDVLFFGGVAHGTTAWRSSWYRRCVIQFIASRSVRVPPGKYAGWRWSAVDKNKALDAATAKT